MLFFNKVAGNFIKREPLAQVFFYQFCEISKSTFSYKTPLGDGFWIFKVRGRLVMTFWRK